jgi:hypothetical protein
LQVVVVVADILDCPNVQGDELWETLQGWSRRGGAPRNVRVRVLRVQAASDRLLPSVLAQNVFPTIDDPDCALAVFRANTTVLQEVRLVPWLHRWLESDRVVWVAAQRRFPLGDVPSLPHALAPCDIGALPGWSVFSGPAGTLADAMAPHGIPDNTTLPADILLPIANLDAREPALVRCTYLHGGSLHAGAVRTWFWRVAARAAAAAPFLISLCVNLLLVVILIVLACIQCK